MTTSRHSPLQIAVLCEFPTLLGGERSMLAIEPALRLDGCELIWLAPDGGPLAAELRRRGSRVVPFSIRDAAGRMLPDDVARHELTAELSSLRIQLIHGNSLAMSRWLGRNADRLPVPTTGHVRDIIGLSQSAISDVNRNRWLIAVSQATRNFHVAQGIDAERLRVVYNGIDVREFANHPTVLPSPPGRGAGGECEGDIGLRSITHPQADGLDRPSSVREELRLPPDAFLVAAIGQIGLRKGQTTFAEAAVLLNQRVAAATGRPIHYLLIGERHSDKEESRLFDKQITSIVSQGGIANRFHRLGYRDDVPELLSEIDVVVHPARQEPLGRVLLEAAAAGRAIIATDVGGTREILTDEVSSLLFAPDDPQRLSQHLRRLWNDDALRQRLGEAARHTVANRFTVESCSSGCLEVWRQCSDSEAGTPCREG